MGRGLNGDDLKRRLRHQLGLDPTAACPSRQWLPATSVNCEAICGCRRVVIWLRNNGTESVIRGYFREHVDAIGAAIAWG
jgi:hypothetical protein